MAGIDTTIRRWCGDCQDFTKSDICGYCTNEICSRCGCTCNDGDDD